MVTKRPFPRQVTVLVDSREKNPVLFPETIVMHMGGHRYMVRVKTRIKKMDAGDYAVLGQTRRVLIERKGHLNELHQNLCTKDTDRFYRALTRFMEATQKPILLLDMTPADACRPTQYVEDPGAVMDRFYEMIANEDVRLIFAGSCKHPTTRRMLGEQLLRIMLWEIYGVDKELTT